MMSRLIVAAALALALACRSFAASPPRLDATSAQSAQTTWNGMLNAATPQVRQELLVAMLKINLAGVQSASDPAGTPPPGGFGIVRIKDKVAGMTAPEIISYANKVSTVKLESSGP